MTISLSKGGNIDLTKSDPTLDAVLVGLGWDVRQTDGATYDLDASVFLLNSAGKVRSDDDFCFYKQLSVANGAVVHQGDNLTGAGDGDDEQIKIKLSALPNDVDRVALVITIHEAEKKGQNFGQVANANVRIVNDVTGVEITHYDLSEDASTDTAVTIGELYRKDSDWKFRAVGTGFKGGLAAMCRMYGVNV